MSKNETIRVLFSVCLIPLGAVLILLHNDSPAGNLLSHVGFAFIVAGVLSTFHELVLQRFEQGEMASAVADEVYERLRKTPLAATGIRLVSPSRKGYDGYYKWVLGTAPDHMFFAGRSVLHRVAADLKERGLGDAESAIARRLAEGATIKLLFVDPRSDIVPRMAKEEGQSTERLLSDLAITLGICIRLHNLLGSRRLPATARLDICVFDEVPYFAYHSVGDAVVVGFYFASALGFQSAAYELVDPQTKEFFVDHFRSILGRAGATYVLRINPHSGRSELNEPLVAELRKRIVDAIGETATYQYMNTHSQQ
jgi:hypothetical protein